MKKAYTIMIVIAVIAVILGGTTFFSVINIGSHTRLDGANNCILYDGSGSCMLIDKTKCNSDGSNRDVGGMSCGCEEIRKGGVYTNCQRHEGSMCGIGFTDKTKTFSCQDGWVYSVDTPSGYSYFCYNPGDIEQSNFVVCEETCDPITGQCGEGTRVCNEGYMQCSNNQVEECINNAWVKKQDCGSSSCTERSYNNAYCKTNIYYCPNQGQMNCMTCDDGYTTQQECLDNLDAYCYSPNTNTCTTKKGQSCQANEVRYNTLQSCKNAVIANIVCSSDSQCDDGNICTSDKCVQSLFTAKCQNTMLSNCQEIQQCDAKNFLDIPLYQWKTSEEVSGGWVCKVLKIGCTTTNTSSCQLNYPFLIIAGGVVLVSLYLFGKSKKKGGKK